MTHSTLTKPALQGFGSVPVESALIAPVTLILEVHGDALALRIAIEHALQRIFTTHSTLFKTAV